MRFKFQRALRKFTPAFGLLGYALVLSSFWYVGLLILFSLAIANSLFYTSEKTLTDAVEKIVLLSIVVLLMISLLWCPFYQSVVSWVMSLGYEEGVAYYLLPNLSLLTQLFPTPAAVFLYYVGVAVLCLAMLLVVLSIIDAESVLFLRALLSRVRLVTTYRKLTTVFCIFLALFSAAFVAITLFVLLGGEVEDFVFFVCLAHGLRFASIWIPFVVIPLLVWRPSLLGEFSKLLEEVVFRLGRYEVRCYHFLILFVLSGFLLINYTLAAPNDPHIGMCDDRIYHSIWVSMKSGDSFYEAWKKEFPPDPRPYMHYSIAYFMWLCCERVECVKLEYFLLSSLAISASFYLMRHVSSSAFLGALSMLYLTSFFSIRIFWFMLEPWAASPAVLGMAFLPYGYYLASSIFFTISFFFKETMLPPLLIAAGFFPFIRVYKAKKNPPQVLSKELFFPACLFLVGAFILTHPATYLCKDRMMHLMDRFAPYLFIHQLACFMFPIGLVNFLLAMLGLVEALRKTRHRLVIAYLLLTAIATHILNIVYTGGLCSLSSARHSEAAVLIEFLAAPLGICVYAEKTHQLYSDHQS